MRDLFPQFNELIFNIESTVLKLNINHIAIAYALTEVWKSSFFEGRAQQIFFFELVFVHIIWSSCTNLVLSASWIHGQMAQLIRASERISVVVGSNPSQANFSYF